MPIPTESEKNEFSRKLEPLSEEQIQKNINDQTYGAKDSWKNKEAKRVLDQREKNNLTKVIQEKLRLAEEANQISKQSNCIAKEANHFAKRSNCIAILALVVSILIFLNGILSGYRP